MLPKANIDALKAMGLDYDALVAAIKDTKEVAITLPEGSFYSDADITELKDNVKKGHEQAYREIWGKEMNEKHALGLSTRDAKNPEKIAQAFMTKGAESANVEPNAKITELEASIKRLQTEVIPEKDRLYSELEGKHKGYLERETYISALPKDINPLLTPDEHIARIKAVAIRGENGEAINPATNQPYKDKMEKVVPFADKVQEYYKANPALLQAQQAPAAPARPMNHSTQGKQVGKLDMTQIVQSVQSQYDMTTRAGREAAQAAITAAQVANAQANTA